MLILFTGMKMGRYGIRRVWDFLGKMGWKG
jgi:hypothetical protein